MHCAKLFEKNQGLVKGEKFCFRNPYFYFQYGESTSMASQKSKDLNKVSLLLQDLDLKAFLNYNRGEGIAPY